MKNRFLLITLFLTHSIISQIVVKGTVYEKSGPLEGAAVYLNNTMLGTTTNENGEFELPVDEGHHELIISYLGFKTINYNLLTKDYKKPLIFALEENSVALDEIIIKKLIHDKKWKADIRRFSKEFFGNTALAKECEILNPKALFFDYDAKNDVFSAFAKEPLKIKHKGLGYLITYDLIFFSTQKEYLKSLGYSKFEKLKGNKRKQRKWKENRLKTYKGSVNHFLNSVLSNKIKREGFEVQQFKRFTNPKRPSEEEIKKAEKIIFASRKIQKSRKLDVNSLKNLDNALSIIRKAKLPKYSDTIYRKKLRSKHILDKKDGTLKLDFNDNLLIIYKKEKEERNYRKFGILKPQMSTIIPKNRPILIDENGILENPLDVLYEGYWSFERHADTLPLDYKPPKN